jgi:neutral amino acid transport system permease protein
MRVFLVNAFGMTTISEPGGVVFSLTGESLIRIGASVQLSKTGKRTVSALAAVFAAMMLLLALPMSASADEVGTEFDDKVFGNVKLDGESLSGVEITVSGNGYEATTVTGEDGRWLVGVPERGEYQVSLNEDTLPAGIAVVEDGGPIKQVEFGLTGTVVLNYFIGEGERSAARSR